MDKKRKSLSGKVRIGNKRKRFSFPILDLGRSGMYSIRSEFYLLCKKQGHLSFERNKRQNRDNDEERDNEWFINIKDGKKLLLDFKTQKKFRYYLLSVSAIRQYLC
jgi:hypothetical protein